ncbi:Multidrug efflux protein, outer membrane component [Lunatimonas lonarensis]|uniref:Multidrug efflux protein, outer membrane component n=1 Tax=Lunatimonas lonarensis TaxID=1232681 RepID=R7ZNX5_9BACT|nr:TolC family protein [Lunatimonas lonarensis]EON75810.1 Multidrug efflux protein, outer membrane component [Lunatimonas lonarensis]
MQQRLGYKGGLFLMFLLLANTTWSYGQEILTYSDFLTWVREFHPIAKQGDLTIELGRQELRMARGGFDPILYGDQNEKNYNNTQYYNKREAGIVVPTMAGVEFKGTFEQNAGVYLNRENTVPQVGLLAAGASINLGEGLFIDRRRAALRQAQIFANATDEERKFLLNSLYLDATFAYWDWAKAYANLEVFQEGVSLAEIRFEAIKSSFEFGDLPAIDTVEAYTQVLNRMIRLQNAENVFFAKTQELNVFLWDEDETPIFLNEGTVPVGLTEGPVDLVDITEYREVLPSHPEIRLLDYDLEFLDVDRRWKVEQLKPIVKLNYNFLSESVTPIETGAFFQNDYKWGITISTPLLLRRERGSLGVTKAKINMTRYKRDLSVQKLLATLEKEYNTFLVLGQQQTTFDENIKGLERLLEGEKIRFDQGESSLFLINAREVALFDALVVLNSINADKKIAVSKVRVAAGLGFEE